MIAYVTRKLISTSRSWKILLLFLLGRCLLCTTNLKRKLIFEQFKKHYCQYGEGLEFRCILSMGST